MSETFYNILGVEETATKDELKRAYRSLQMKYHPDRNSSSQESIIKTQQINEAYEVLGDVSKRLQYDMMRSNPFSNSNMGSHNDAHNVDIPLNDIFHMIFGGMPRSMNSNMNTNMRHPGHPTQFPKFHVFSDVFSGSGPINFHQTMNKPVPIIKSVEINMNQVYSGASVPLEIERWIIENGNKIYETETIYINIPQGIDDNEMIILREKGNVINDECKGDIKLNITIQNTTLFSRVGLDLIIEKSISLKDSLCGFTFELNHLNGKTYTLNNNKGNIVPSDYKKVYPDMGLKRGEHKGNMIIIFKVQFPEKLSDLQIEKLREIL